MWLLLNARPALLGIKQTVKVREGVDRLLQMETFKSGKDHSWISIYQIQQATLRNVYEMSQRDTALTGITPDSSPSTERPPRRPEESLLPLCPHCLCSLLPPWPQQHPVLKRAAVESRQANTRKILLLPFILNIHLLLSTWAHFPFLPSHSDSSAEEGSPKTFLWSSEAPFLSFFPNPNPSNPNQIVS